MEKTMASYSTKSLDHLGLIAGMQMVIMSMIVTVKRSN